MCFRGILKRERVKRKSERERENNIFGEDIEQGVP